MPHQPKLWRRGFKKILYRATGSAAILAGVVSCAVLASAQVQEEVPQITPRPKNFDKKKDQGPRALGLLQLTSNGKATLVPIAILINGRFYDAAAYKATPVPMALDSGTVYEGERTGNSQGLFTINGALHSQTVNAAVPWIGTGSWLPTGTETPKTSLKAESVPRGIETSDEPPRLTKGGNTPKDAPPEKTAPSTPAPTTSGQPSGSNPPGASQPSGGSTAPASPNSAKPSDQSTAPSGGQSNSQSADSNRPRLRRGKPTQPLPADDEVPGYGKPGSANTAAAANAGTATKGPVELVPAISDAGGPDPRSYKFEWLKGEEEERRTQMMALAKDQLRAYLDAQAKGTIVPKTSGTHATATGRKSTPKTVQPVLENVQFRTFDLWGNNQPVLVLSAEAHLLPAPANGSTAGSTVNGPAADKQFSSTLVARTDIYGNLHKLYSGVTDKYHLDLTPRLELIDAVDADGDGRGELLFRETSDAGSGFVIYRATADTLWKMFDSLNPE